MSLIEKGSHMVRWIEGVPVLLGCAGVVIGAMAGTVGGCVAGILAGCVLAVLRSRGYAALAVGFLLIGFRIVISSLAAISDDDISHLNGSYQMIRAYVSGDIVLKPENVKAVLDVEEVCVEEKELPCEDWRSVSGKIQVWLPRYPPVRMGDEWIVGGKIEKPPDDIEGFSYSAYLARNDIYSVMYRGNAFQTGGRRRYSADVFLWDVGYVLRRKIEYILPEPHASLLAGMLFGFRSGQFETFMEELQRTGVTHVIAASGYNVAVVSGFVSKLTSRFHRRAAAVCSIFFIWIFAGVAGGSVPVVRSAVMSTYSMTALLLGYASTVHVSFFLSMGMFLLMDPSVIEDISFQLSFASTAGLVYISPVVESLFPPFLRYIRENAVTTISALLATLPISLAQFGSFSSVAIIVNMIVLPLVSPAMGLGAVLLVLPSSLGLFSKSAALVSWVPLDVFVKVVEFFSRIPWAMVEGEAVSWRWAAVFYLVLFTVVIALNKNKKGVRNAIT